MKTAILNSAGSTTYANMAMSALLIATTSTGKPSIKCLKAALKEARTSSQKMSESTFNRIKEAVQDIKEKLDKSSSRAKGAKGALLNQIIYQHSLKVASPANSMVLSNPDYGSEPSTRTSSYASLHSAFGSEIYAPPNSLSSSSSDSGSGSTTRANSLVSLRSAYMSEVSFPSDYSGSGKRV